MCSCLCFGENRLLYHTKFVQGVSHDIFHWHLGHGIIQWLFIASRVRVPTFSQVSFGCGANSTNSIVLIVQIARSSSEEAFLQNFLQVHPMGTLYVDEKRGNGATHHVGNLQKKNYVAG